MSRDVTVSLLIIDDTNKNNSQFLSIDNTTKDFDILIPSGKLNNNETYLDAAIRICKNETGLIITTLDLQFFSIDNFKNDHLNITYLITKWTTDMNQKKGTWLNINELQYSNSYVKLYQKYNTFIDNKNKSSSILSYIPSCNLL